MTTLFADLVGFTALGERHDPEDVNAALRAFFDLARGVIERFGGSVEKFIGDAVVGLFGIPLAHEDDAERAVRAALEILARMADIRMIGDEPLRARAGVDTGAALVRLQVLPNSGEGMLVGDAVNTAARLLAAAPPMTVVVGATTHELTERAITYERLSDAIAKGKAKPVERWAARGAIARRGAEADRRDEPAMVGREIELAVLSGLLDRAVASCAPQFALVNGEAGVGKSRLIREFFRLIDDRPGLMCTWRQGHCPPYGDGLSYHALREILSAHAGISPRDTQDTVEAKLRRATEGSSDSEWLASRLRPLVGLPAPPADRDENLAALTSFLLHVAQARPTVLVVEDLHWAPSATLEFFGHFVRHAQGVPLLLLGTARPELRAMFPNVDDRSLGIRHIDLKSLSEPESERVIRALCDTPVQADKLRMIVRQCGGNPLFAEELVRYHLEGSSEAGCADAREQPGTIRALIAARLDALSPDVKLALENAAVVGQDFWPRAIAAMSGVSDLAIENAVSVLEDREFIRRSDGAQGGEERFSFWHALVQDVAYSCMTRRERARRHAAVSVWLEGPEGRESVGDVTELLAHHYATALELAQAAHDHGLADQLTVPCAEALAAAARQTLPLDVRTAESLFARAAEVLPSHDPRRPALLSDWGEAVGQLGEAPRAVSLLEEAIDGLRETGDVPSSVVAMIRLARNLYLLGDVGHEGVTRAALELAEGGPPGPEWLLAKAHWCFLAAASFVGMPAVEAADDALRAYEQLGERPSPLVIGYRGMARCDLGDPGGLDDLRAAVRDTIRRGLAYDSAVLSYDLADELHVYRGPRAAMPVLRSAIDRAHRRGDETSSTYLQALLLVLRAYAGQWDRALAEADDLLERLRRNRQAADFVQLMTILAYVRSLRGERVDAEEVRAACEDLLPAGPEELMSYWIHLACVYLRAGEKAIARTLLRQAADKRDGFGCRLQTGMAMPLGHSAAWEVGDPELAARFARGAAGLRAIDRNVLMTHEARVLEAAADFAGAAVRYSNAAEGWKTFGTPLQEAEALGAMGRCLLLTGDEAEATRLLTASQRILRRLGARPMISQSVELLKRTSAPAQPHRHA